ncbi:MAG: HIT family protein [Pseudomonadota bacterium]
MTTSHDRSYDQNNVFARILRDELPAHRVYEDDYSLAFMDLMPQTDGHTLVIPKDPTVDILGADPVILGHTMTTVQRVAAAVKSAFQSPGIMLAQLNGAAAGQTVFHLHFHIMPRFEGVDFAMHARDVADGTVLAEHAERIRKEL